MGLGGTQWCRDEPLWLESHARAGAEPDIAQGQRSAITAGGHGEMWVTFSPRWATIIVRGAAPF